MECVSQQPLGGACPPLAPQVLQERGAVGAIFLQLFPAQPLKSFPLLPSLTPQPFSFLDMNSIQLPLKIGLLVTVSLPVGVSVTKCHAALGDSSGAAGSERVGPRGSRPSEDLRGFMPPGNALVFPAVVLFPINFLP